MKNSFQFAKMRTFAFILFNFISFADYGQGYFGIKGGLNICDVVMNDITNPDAEDDFNFKLGVHSGFFANVAFNDSWGAAAELLYSGKGVKAAGTVINLHYVVLPLLLQYAIADNLKAEGGFELGYLVLADSKYGTVYSWNNKLDLGLDIGLVFSLLKNAHMGVRFNAGILNVIQPVDANSNFSNVKYQNRVLSLTVGYTLGNFLE